MQIAAARDFAADGRRTANCAGKTVSGGGCVTQLKHFAQRNVRAELARHGCSHACPTQGKSRQNFFGLARRAFAKAGPLLAKRPARQAATRRSADSRHPDQQTRIPPTSPTGSHSAPRTRVRRRMRAGQSPSDQRSTGCGRVPGKIARGEYRGKAMSTHTVQRPSRRSSSEAAHVRAAARAPAAGRNGRRFRVVPGCRRAARIDSCARAGKPHPADRCVRAGACIRVRATPRLF